MPTNLTCFRVFIASPGGLTEERRAFRDEIQDYNESEAIHRGVLFQPFGWEDTLGGVGRPQSIINEDILCSDFFVLLIWNRWGSAPDVKSSGFSSGTEEEYHVALECYHAADHPMRQLVLLFKAVDPQQLVDPGPQLESVLEFKKGMEEQKTTLFHTFDSIPRFQQLLRAHLAAWLRAWEKDSDDAGKSSSGSQIASDTLLVRDGDFGELLGASERVNTSLTAKAWALANEGRLTEAEVEFARAIMGRPRPEAFLSYGQFLYRVGRLDQATVLFEQAIEIAEAQSGHETALASATNSLGRVRQIRGELKGAEQMFRRAIEINQKLGHLQEMANSYGNLGSTLREGGDPDGAEQMYRKSLEVNEKLGSSRSLAYAYIRLAKLQAAHGDLEGAEKLLRQALKMGEELSELEVVADCYASLGGVLGTRGDRESAKELIRKSLDIDQKLGRLEGLANSYTNLGIVLWQQDDLEAAESMLHKSLEINERLGKLVGLAACYGNLGNILRQRGEADEAEQMHRKALEIAERLGKLEARAACYANLGNLLSDREDLQGAEQLYRRALEINVNLGWSEGMAIAYANLGNLLHKRGEPGPAAQMYQKSLVAAERMGSSPLIARAKALLRSLQNTPSGKRKPRKRRKVGRKVECGRPGGAAGSQ